jgi:NAD(P)-dependent dehydrogenase (short-subunit alcohol dehydrogenase family)
METAGMTTMVTGAGRGLGKEICLAFARAGARVSMVSLLSTELEETAVDIKKIGNEYILVEGDVSQKHDAVSAVAQTINLFGGIDVLVNNAGILGPARFLEDTTPEQWEKTLAVNLTGSYLFTREVIPHMIRQGGGAIINIVSGLGQMPFPRLCAYSVSKAGLIQLTRSLSEELKPFNIRVNGIDPGLMDTSLGGDLRKMGPELLGEELHNRMVHYKEHNILKNPSEVAGLAVYLASKDSGGITGHIGTMRYYQELGWESTDLAD